MNPAIEESLAILEILRLADAEELERKRRLGHYAAIWRDDKPVIIDGENDPALTETSEMGEFIRHAQQKQGE